MSAPFAPNQSAPRITVEQIFPGGQKPVYPEPQPKLDDIVEAELVEESAQKSSALVANHASVGYDLPMASFHLNTTDGFMICSGPNVCHRHHETLYPTPEGAVRAVYGEARSGPTSFSQPFTLGDGRTQFQFPGGLTIPVEQSTRGALLPGDRAYDPELRSFWTAELDEQGLPVMRQEDHLFLAPRHGGWSQVPVWRLV